MSDPSQKALRLAREAEGYHELDLFEEVVGDISYALYGLEVEEERKHLEKELMASEALFRGFMQSATERFVIFDADMRFIAVNDSWLQRSDLKREDVIGKHVL